MHPRYYRRPLLFTRSLLLIVCLLVTGLLIPAGVTLAQGGVVVTTGNNLRMRSAPSLDSVTLLVVPYDTSLNAIALDSTRNWVQASYNGQTGWLALNFLRVAGNLGGLPVAESSPTSGPAAQESASPGSVPDATLLSGVIAPGTIVAPTVGLRLRGGPGTSFETILVVPAGQPLTVLAISPQDDSWVRATYGDTVGWVARSFLQVIGTSSAANPAAGAAGSGTVLDVEVGAEVGVLLQLVNQARAEAGLHGLRLNPVLNMVAQRHADDLLANGMFRHTGSDGSNVATRADDAGYAWWSVGENLAEGQDLSIERAFQLWMGSRGHRANILRPRFTEMGLAIARSDGGWVYYVQVFGLPK